MTSRIASLIAREVFCGGAFSTKAWMRDRPPNEVADVCCHVERETDAGLIVSGAKVVATGSALTNYTFVAHHGLIPLQDKNFALVFMLPTNAAE